MELGAAVPSMNTSWSLRSASTLVTPSGLINDLILPIQLHPLAGWRSVPSTCVKDEEMSLTQPSQVMGTANVVCADVSVGVGRACVGE